MSTLSRAAPESALVKYLIRLADTADKESASRAALAELRRGLNNPVRMARHVARFVPTPDSKADEDREERYYWIAALFAWHKEHRSGMSLGHAFAVIKDKSDSIEKRFFALLAAPSENLPDRLGQAVRLLASNNVPLDWHQLLHDILHWDDAKKPRQMRLAKDFYGRPADAPAEGTADQTIPTEGEEQP